MEELIAKRYVDALLSVSDEKEQSLYVETFNNLTQSVGDDQVAFMIDAPIIASSDKVAALIATLGDKPNAKLVNFIKLLGEHKRLGLIPAIANVLNTNIQKKNNSYSGFINSKEELANEKITQIEETLKRYTGSDIKLEQKQSDIDGLRVDVEDLGIEINFSKERVKEQLIDFIMKSY